MGSSCKCRFNWNETSHKSTQGISKYAEEQKNEFHIIRSKWQRLIRINKKGNERQTEADPISLFRYSNCAVNHVTKTKSQKRDAKSWHPHPNRNCWAMAEIRAATATPTLSLASTESVSKKFQSVVDRWPNYCWGINKVRYKKSPGHYAHLPLDLNATSWNLWKNARQFWNFWFHRKSRSSQVADRISGKVFFYHHYSHFKCPTIRLRCKSISLSSISSRCRCSFRLLFGLLFILMLPTAPQVRQLSRFRQTKLRARLCAHWDAHTLSHSDSHSHNDIHSYGLAINLIYAGAFFMHIRNYKYTLYIYSSKKKTSATN